MIAILRTILAVSITVNAVIFGAGALFGLSPTQSVGAEIIFIITWATIKGWRAVLRAANRPLRQDWPHGCDHVDRLPVPRVTAELVDPPAPRVRVQPPAQIEAPQTTKEIDYAPRNVPRISR